MQLIELASTPGDQLNLHNLSYKSLNNSCKSQESGSTEVYLKDYNTMKIKEPDTIIVKKGTR